MRDFLTKNKKILPSLLLILAVSFLGVFVFQVHSARAWNFIDIAFDSMAWIFAYIGAIIQAIVNIFFWMASMLFEIAFRLSGFTTAGIVQVGWHLTRDLVNMFFVLVLLFIAFATILHQEQFGAKKILPRLIIVALLINFSLPICGVIIDGSQVVTDFFISENGAGTISEQLASVLHVQKISELNPDANIPEKMAAGMAGLVMVIFSIYLGILLMLAATIAIGLGAFFLITRLIAIWILLILAPLAWFAWILPSGAGYAKEWWKKFLKWVFFAPTYTFFIWLAIKAGQAGAFTGIINQEVQNIVNANGFTSTIGVALASSPVLFLQFILIIGILFAGLKIASDYGAYGAATAQGWYKAAGTGVAGWAAAKAKGAGARPLGAATGAAANFLGKVPGMRRFAAEPLRTISEKSRAEANAIIESYKKKYGNWTEGNLKSRFKTADPREKVAIAQILASKGKLSPTDDKLNPTDKLDPAKQTGFTEKDIGDALQITKRYEENILKTDILKTRPDLISFVSKNPDEDTKEVISKLKPKDMENLQSISLGSYDKNGKFEQTRAGQKEALFAVKQQLTKKGGKLGSNHLSELEKNNPNTFEIIKKEVIAIEKMEEKEWNDLKSNRPDIVRYLNSEPGKVIFGERPEIKAEKKSTIIAGNSTQTEFQQAKKGYRGK